MNELPVSVHCCLTIVSKALLRISARGSLGFLVGAEGVVQPGDTALELIHGQGPVLIEELRHRPGHLRLPGDGRRRLGKGHAERVLVIEPFQGGRELPHVVGVESCRVLLQRHQENVPLSVRGVERQERHHDEVRDDTQGQHGSGLGEGVKVVPQQSHDGKHTGHSADQETAVHQGVVLYVTILLQQDLGQRNTISKTPGLEGEDAPLMKMFLSVLKIKTHIHSYEICFVKYRHFSIRHNIWNKGTQSIQYQTRNGDHIINWKK